MKIHLACGLGFLMGWAACAQEIKTGEVTVVTFISTTCPVSNSYNDRMKDLYRYYAGKGVKFVFLNSNQNESAAAIQDHARQAGFEFPVHKDAGNVLADRFGAQYTPESFLLDRTGNIRYHGRIDDAQNPARVRQNSLRLALDAVLSGGEVAVGETKAFGCTIKREQRKLSRIDETGYRELLKSMAGNVVLVDFWATWCAPCREEMPLLAKLDGKLRDQGFRLVTISADEPEHERAAVEFVKKSGITGPAYLRRAKDDDKFINSIDPKWSGALPALFLYDRQGEAVKSYIGEADLAAIEAAIRKIL
jgi:thiol-disulfide isomerase/thioredoxin